MKLYFSPGACSLSPHIVAREAGVPLELVEVDLGTKTYGDGRDYLAVNPKGYVPALELDDGQVLTEGPAIVQYLAELSPSSGLAPTGGLPRARLLELLGFINAEIHKTYGPLFDRTISAELRGQREAHLHRRYAVLERQLGDRPHLLGDEFSVADAYLYTVTTWAKAVGFDLTAFPNLRAFSERVAARPAVRAARAAEGLPA